MKVITYLKSAFAWTKSKFELLKNICNSYKWLIMLFLLLTTIISIRSCINQKQSKESTVITSEK